MIAEREISSALYQTRSSTISSPLFRHIWQSKLVSCPNAGGISGASYLRFPRNSRFHWRVRFSCIQNPTLPVYHTARKLLSLHLGFHFNTDLFDFPNGGITHHHDYFIVDDWIKFAISHHTENLSFDFFLHHYREYTFPDIFYANPSLKQLSLALHSCTTLIPRSTVFWPSLKSLFLAGCNISDESAAMILSGCPVLESLTLNLSQLLGRLDLSKSMHWTRLEIDLNTRDYRSTDPGPTEIVAPHIHYLRLKTYEIPCTFLDVSSLTQAKLDIFYRWRGGTVGDFLHVMDLKILAKLHNIDKLTLGAIFLQLCCRIRDRLVFSRIIS